MRLSQPSIRSLAGSFLHCINPLVAKPSQVQLEDIFFVFYIFDSRMVIAGEEYASIAIAIDAAIKIWSASFVVFR